MERRLTASILVLVLAGALLAQPKLVKDEDTDWIQLSSDGSTVHQALLLVTEHLGLRLQMHPEAFARATEARLVAHTRSMPPGDLLSCIGGAHDLSIRREPEVLRVDVLSRKEEDHVEAGRLRRGALATVRRILIVPGDPFTGEALLMAGVLHRGAGDLRESVVMLQRFLSLHPDDRRGPWVRQLAAASCFELGSFEECRALLRGIENFDEEAPERFRAQLLMAQIDLLDGDEAAALNRLGRILNEGPKDRVQALSLLLQAETLLGLDSPDAALQALDAFDGDLQRTNPDLAQMLPYARGRCLLAAEELGSAMPFLRLAIVSDEDPERRVLAAIAMARAYERLGDPVASLVALRTARRLLKRPEELLRATVQEVAVLVRHGVIEEAVNRLHDLLRDEGAYVDLPQWPQALETLAGLELEAGRPDVARSTYKRLESLGDADGWIRYRIARCEYEAGRYQAALETLATVKPVAGGRVSTQELARLRGECWLELGRYEEATRAFAETAPAAPTIGNTESKE